jgi:sulfatase maturation enzyme AslB (radical SAM superfamily)
MQKFHTITPVNADPFMITWDIGRRCNFDCSYCPAHRHDNFSSHASLQDLKCTAEFLFQYIETVAQYRLSKDFHVSFTGGEPTVNPKFIELVSYLRSRYADDFQNKFNLNLSLTTNGAMGEKMVAAVVENFD